MRLHRPRSPEPHDPPQPPADRPRRCPTCGREAAVVFYAVHDTGPAAQARLVCLECCPRPEDETKT